MLSTEEFLQDLNESDFVLEGDARATTIICEDDWHYLPGSLREFLHDALVKWAQTEAPGTWASTGDGEGLFLCREATAEEKADDLLRTFASSQNGRYYWSTDKPCSAWRRCDDLGGRYAEDVLLAENVELFDALVAAFSVPKAARAFVQLPDGGTVDVS